MGGNAAAGISEPIIRALLRAYNDNIDDKRRDDLYRYAVEAVGTRSDFWGGWSDETHAGVFELLDGLIELGLEARTESLVAEAEQPPAAELAYESVIARELECAAS